MRDGYDEIVVSQGPDPKNTVILRVFKRDGTTVTECTAFDSKYGLTLFSADLDGDGIDEFIRGFGFGPQNAAWVKVFKADGTEITSFLAYPENIGYGVKVSTGKTGE